MVQDIKITPTPISFSGSVATATGTPQLLFRGSGAQANDIELNVQSNSDLSFQGTQGELFSITNELQSGTIFAVKDISGIDQISVNASGEVKLNQFYGYASVSGAFKTPLVSGTDGSTVTFDLNDSNTHRVTLGGNRTLAITNVSYGQKFTTRLTQDGTGSRTVTWFNDIHWAEGGTAPTLTTTAHKSDLFGFLCTAVSGSAAQSGDFDGFIIGQNI